jgi:predicted dithiol-disulfide oxidoreductase (DUF899 family)
VIWIAVIGWGLASLAGWAWLSARDARIYAEGQAARANAEVKALRASLAQDPVTKAFAFDEANRP